MYASLMLTWTGAAFGAALVSTVIVPAPSRTVEPARLSSVIVPAPSQTTGPAPATAYPEPEPCRGNCSSFADQTIIQRRSDAMYFRYAFDNDNNRDVVWTAKHIGGPWNVTGTKLLANGTTKSPFGPKDAPWAPDVHYVDGQYVLIYTDHHTPQFPGGGSANVTISYAISKTLEAGSFEDYGPIGIPDEDRTRYSRIGGNLLPGANPPQVAFGSDRWGIFGVNVSINLPHIAVLPSSKRPAQLIASQNPPKGEPRNLTEGPFQYQHPTNGYTYLFYSVGLNVPPKNAPYGDSQRIEACRSSNPYYGFVNHHGQSCLRGGNEPSGYLVIQSHGTHVVGPGSPGVIDVPNVGPYLIYQYIDSTLSDPYAAYNRLYGHNYIDFSSGWPKLAPVPTTAA